MNVAGFRGFARDVEFDLNADVVLLYGPNGTGKTSFFDAILWGLTGSIERIGSDASLINKFSEFGDARVEIDLKTQDGSVLRVVRRFSDIATLTVALDGGKSVTDEAAQALLQSMLYPDGNAEDGSLEAFSRWLPQFGYLEQDRVNAFVEANDDQQRFQVVGELVGASRLNRLNLELERSRKSWTTETNKRKDKISALHKNRNDLRNRFSRIDHAINIEQLGQKYVEWSREANRLAERIHFKVSADSIGPEAWARVVDGVIQRVSIELRTLEVLSDDIVKMKDTFMSIPVSTEDHSSLLAVIEETRVRRAEAATNLSEAEETATKARRRRLAEAEMSRSLAGMAQLALKHLGESCPVCSQSYDARATEKRLRALIEREDLPVEDLTELRLIEAANTLRSLEEQLASERARLRMSESTSRQLNELWFQVESLAQRLELDRSRDDQSLSNSLDELEAEIYSRKTMLLTFRDSSEGLSVSLARVIEASDADRLHRQIEELDRMIALEESECALRDQASEDAQHMHEAVRDLSKSLVEKELHRIGPILQKIYGAVDPHPEFKIVRFLTDRRRGRGQLWTTLEASMSSGSLVVREPRTVLSSSQLNVLAVAIFLSLNLSMKNPPLEIIALDDPLQSLDNINLLGLADLLRRLRAERQVFLSTHDRRLAGLMERKLRPIGEHERTVSISLDAWDRSGPIVTSHTVKRDTRGLRLVAA